MRLKQRIDGIDDLICINPDTLKIYYEHSITLITQSLRRLAQQNKSDGDGSIFVMPTIDISKGAEMILDQSTIHILLSISLSALVVNDSQPLILFKSAVFPVFYVSKTTTTNRIFAQFCMHYYNYPRHSIRQVIGITGTNVGLIGTLGYRCRGHENNTNNYINTDCTTPDAWLLQTILNEMKNKYHIENVVLEVSPHGLALDRVYGCDFSVAVLTNFTQDHLGFHKTMDNYLQSKLLLLSKYLSKSLSPKAIINHDDPSYEKFVNACPSNAEVYTYDGTSYTVLIHSGEIRRVHLNIHGEFNVYNSLACIATCSTTYSHFLTLDQIIQSLQSFQCVKGRFEFHISHRPFSVVVDFAHTPDGLEKVIKSGRQILLESAENGRLIVVFGSSGRGDRSKRPLFGRIADEHSDIIIVTSDNPFQENPQNIIDEIVSGIQQSPDENRLYVELYRKKAIHLAMDLAKGRNDLIIIADKGHETVQIFADHAIEFNEKEIIEGKYWQLVQDNISSI